MEKGFKATDKDGKCRGYQYSLPTKNEDGTCFKKVCRKIRLVKELFADGDSNTGNSNTGNSNTGDRNTGDWNTGNRNTGYSNTGNWNTGCGNACNRSAGYFCVKTPPLIFFDKKVNKEDEENMDWDLANELAEMLMQDDPFDYKKFTTLPNATAKKIKELHQKHIEGRKK